MRARYRRVPLTLVHACLCCGYRTFATPPPGTREHCPVCRYFDRALEATVDRWTLWRAQVSFDRCGAFHRAFLDRVRAPETEEPRDPAWRIDHEPERRRAELADTAERKIREAFATVSPEGRITLGQAYRSEYPGLAPMWEWDDLDRHWSEIPDLVLEMCARLSGIFSFGNFESFRYYLPAYLLLSLRGGGDETTFYAVTNRRVFGRGDETAPPEAVLSPDQCDAVRAFLAFEAEFGSSNERVIAQAHMGHYAPRPLGAPGEPVPTL